MKNKTRVSFWATMRGDWLDKRMKEIYYKLLKLEDEVGKLRDIVFDMGTKPEVIDFRKGLGKKKK